MTVRVSPLKLGRRHRIHQLLPVPVHHQFQFQFFFLQRKLPQWQTLDIARFFHSALKLSENNNSSSRSLLGSPVCSLQPEPEYKTTIIMENNYNNDQNDDMNTSKMTTQLSSSSSGVEGSGSGSGQPADTIIQVVDNPCWGSPTSCSLQHLLQRVTKDNSILYESKDFIALMKPPDLRMDGDYPATVHKLLTYWYPPPSLLLQQQQQQQQQQLIVTSNSNDKDYDEQQHAQQQQQLLTLVSNTITNLHRHSDLPDNELRPCHQLDYATSGVLLVARSREAAARAQHAFEHRHVRKTYSAVLLGHFSAFVHVPVAVRGTAAAAPTQSDVKVDVDWPVLSAAALQTTMAQIEDAYRKSRHRLYKETYSGYLPVHGLFQQWQHQQQQPKKTATPNLTKKAKTTATTKDGTRLCSNEWNEVWSELNLSETDKQMALTTKWKNLRKASDHQWLVAQFQRAAVIYNRLTKAKIQQQQAENEKHTEHSIMLSLPTFFCVKEDLESFSETFYISAPLAQVKDDFAMRIHPAQRELCSHLKVGGESTLDFKPSLTKCTILHRTYLQSNDDDEDSTSSRLLTRHGEVANTIPSSDNDNSMQRVAVTIVQMEPKTGRRHQLRVHAALAGHPMAGDPTYSSSGGCGGDGGDEHQQQQQKQQRRSAVQRLCLHSASLEIPGLLSDDGDFKVESESPFRLDQNGDESIVNIRMF